MDYACLGPKGTFSEEVARRYYADQTEEGGLLFPSNFEVVKAVASGKAVTGIVPLENSTEGTVNQVIDAILESLSLHIIDEMVAPIYHHLIGFKSERPHSLEGIGRVISHPQALAQCHKWLQKYLPWVTLEETSSTARAAEIVWQKKERYVAAIGNRSLVKLYGLDILADSIHDSKNNVTRFVVLSLSDCSRQKRMYKTSVAFSTPRNKAGSLVDVLTILKEHNINMTRIESRPAKKTLGDYIFFVDFVGHQEDVVVSRALYQMEQQSKFFRILGSYPTRNL